MRISSSFLCLAVLALSATDGVTEGASTLWDHNGSQVSLSATGARRQFHYQIPKAGLLEVGVRPGTLLFDGRRSGDQYSGKAYVFSKVCGAQAYAVVGPVSPDQRTVTVYGKAPIVNSSCRVTGYRDDVLVFNLSPQANGNQTYAEQTTLQQTQQRTSSQEYDIEYDRFVQQFMSCFESARNIDVNIMACNSALSFPRLIDDDRSRLFQRRVALVAQQLTAQKSIGVQPGNPDSTSTASNVRNAITSPQGDNNRTSVIPPNWGPLLSLGAIIVLLAIAGVQWLQQRNSRSSVTAIQNPRDEAPSTAPTSNPSSKAENAIQLRAMADNPQTSYTPNEPPSQSMSLKIKRSQRSNLMGKIVFVLDARIGLNSEEHALVKKYRLGSFVVYDSQARTKHTEAAKAHLETTREHPSLFAGPTEQFLGLGKTLFRIGRASVSATMAALSLRITVDSLIRGVHVECHSMGELNAAEQAIREAAANLKGYLEEAVTFDGREEVIEL